MEHTALNLPRGILFDLDDTIVAFDAVAMQVWKEVVSDFHAKVGISHTALLDAITRASRWYWSDPDRHRTGRNNLAAARRDIVIHAFDYLGINNNDIAVDLADSYSKRRLDAMYVFPGAIDTLRYFHDRGVALALITNGEASVQRMKIARFGLAPFFKAIIIEGEMGFGKPDERFYGAALNTLEATPDNCWIVGDHLEWEIAAPSRLGFYTVWNDYRKRGLPPDTTACPNRIIHSLQDLLPQSMKILFEKE